MAGNLFTDTISINERLNSDFICSIIPFKLKEINDFGHNSWKANELIHIIPLIYT